MNKPMKFLKKEIKPLSEVKKTNKALKVLKFSFFFFIACLVLISAFTIYEFIQTHDFRSPVSFQNPVPRKEIESPVATTSALIKQVEAEGLSLEELLEKETIKKFGISNVGFINTLVEKESSFNPLAMNKTSGACGLFHAYPCEKLLKVCSDLSDYACQINWGLSYIEDRYINPTGALAFWYENGYY